jgi:hypothetical protein
MPSPVNYKILAHQYSLRFLLTFGVATELGEVQSSQFYQAVSANNISGIAALLAQEEPFRLAQLFPLHMLASVQNRSEIATLVFESDLFDVEASPSHGATALMVAACTDNVEMIELLVEISSANVNAQHGFAKTTALHFAAVGHL